jgi:hypothetical protein
MEHYENWLSESTADRASKSDHSHPIGILVKAQKKSGWNGSLTLSLDRGEKKNHQTNRIQTQRS